MQKPVYKTERKPIIDFFGVGFSNKWPKADSSKCSIFEAINLVGVAIHGAAWTGQELYAFDWVIQPAVAEGNRKELLARNESTVKKFPRRTMSLRVPSDGQIGAHVSAWHRHRIKIQQDADVAAEQVLWVENQITLARLSSTVEWIAGKCRDGELQSYCRFVSGGQIGLIAAHEWNVENPIHRFLGKGHYERWFTTTDPVQQFDVYVFLDRIALADLTAKLQFAPVLVKASDLGELSPFLQLAVKIALQNGYKSSAKAETQHIREAELEAAWDDALPNIPRTKRAVEAMAKIMGFPDVKAIRDGQKAQDTKK